MTSVNTLSTLEASYHAAAIAAACGIVDERAVIALRAALAHDDNIDTIIGTHDDIASDRECCALHQRSLTQAIDGQHRSALSTIDTALSMSSAPSLSLATMLRFNQCMLLGLTSRACIVWLTHRSIPLTAKADELERLLSAARATVAGRHRSNMLAMRTVEEWELAWMDARLLELWSSILQSTQFRGALMQLQQHRPQLGK